MNYIRTIVAVGIALAGASCIKDEPLNTECDILTAELPGIELVDVTVISNNAVTFTVRYDQPGPEYAPEFTITEGATISPASGTVRDFTDPQIYTVTSQDGKWHKDYSVRVRRQPAPIVTEEYVYLNYNFEHVTLGTTAGRSYDVFFEPNSEGEEDWAWATANSAFALTLQGKVPEDFPTYQSPDGVDGACAVLVTRSTGTFGASVKKPMAAGNLFMGTFDPQNALQRPLEATHFGRLFMENPISFSGFYKFKAGETYCEPDAAGKLQPVAGKSDMFNLYAVMYEPTEQMQWLDGANVLSESNPNIISTALIPDRHESDEWVEFSVPFVFRPGKSIDQQKLKDGKYRLAVVMSSSENGDYFCGAIGSTLQVDQLTLVCKREKTEEQ